MSVVAFIRGCLAAGMDYETALVAAEQFELNPPRTANAIRQERYRRNKALRVTPVTPPIPQSEVQPLSATIENHQTPNPPPIVPRPSVTLEFDEFWLAYPHKVGKRAAQTAFDRARRRMDLGSIMAGLENSKRSRAWSEGFIPHPTTWLNQDRWSDEPSESARGPPMTGGMVAAASDELAFRIATGQITNGHSHGNPHRDQGALSALPAPSARSG